jgi:hypothetical protein
MQSPKMQRQWQYVWCLKINQTSHNITRSPIRTLNMQADHAGALRLRDHCGCGRLGVAWGKGDCLVALFM